MKTIKLQIAITIFFMLGTIYIGCQTNDSKVEAAKSDVKTAQQDLNSAQQKANADAKQKTMEEEWVLFKKETELKIKVNEARIAELKQKIRNPSKTMDPIYSQKIENLERQNVELQRRLNAYQTTQSDWENFKSEFNRDMKALGDALTDF